MSIHGYVFDYEYIEDKVYLNKINALKKDLKKALEEYEERPQGFIPLEYAEALYEIEKGKNDNSICWIEFDNNIIARANAILYIREKYKITNETAKKLREFIKFKLKADNVGTSNDVKIDIRVYSEGMIKFY